MTERHDNRSADAPAAAVRDRILADHDVLRRMIAAVDQVAGLIEDGEGELADSLRVLLVALFRKLKAHMHYEDEELAPILRDVDAFGDVRAEAFAREHEDQREQMAELLQAATDNNAAPRRTAARAREITARVLSDMDHEEQTFLDPDILRDDVVVADTQTG